MEDDPLPYQPSEGGDGAEVIYALRNDSKLADMILANLKEAGQNIRGSYQRRLSNDSSKDYYFMQRNTGNTNSIIVEYGFIDSKGDDVSQIKNNWMRYADAVIDAVIDYIGYNSIPSLDGAYTVKKGDTLYSIGKKYNISVDALKQINNLETDDLYIGQKLLLSNNPTLTNSYTVQNGDTLYSIANKYGMTVDELMFINNLDSTLLSIGQVLTLSNDDQDMVPTHNTYIVQVGDTLYSISKRYNISVDELKRLNGLDNNLLTIGDTLIVP